MQTSEIDLRLQADWTLYPKINWSPTATRSRGCSYDPLSPFPSRQNGFNVPEYSAPLVQVCQTGAGRRGIPQTIAKDFGSRLRVEFLSRMVAQMSGPKQNKRDRFQQILQMLCSKPLPDTMITTSCQGSGVILHLGPSHYGHSSWMKGLEPASDQPSDQRHSQFPPYSANRSTVT